MCQEKSNTKIHAKFFVSDSGYYMNLEDIMEPGKPDEDIDGGPQQQQQQQQTSEYEAVSVVTISADSASVAVDDIPVAVAVAEDVVKGQEDAGRGQEDAIDVMESVVIDMAEGKNTKVRISFSENYATCARTLGLNVNKRFPFSPSLPHSATEARNALVL